jgi:hypothetical protein
VGIRRGPNGGTKKAKVVVKVAVHFGVVPDTAVQVCAVPSTVPPFINWTVPVGLAPVPDPVTVAVKVMLPPEAMLMEELVNAVVVACPTASETADEVEVA